MYAHSLRSKWPYNLTHFFFLVMVNIKCTGRHSDRGGDDTVGAASHHILRSFTALTEILFDS